ncbi:MAG: cytochrome c, partial [Dehalococcoidia bacterium]
MQRLYVTFAVLGVVSAVLFGVSVWQDSAREWKGYQKTFLRMERDAAQRSDGEPGWRSRTIRIHQILVGDEERVDRRITCHLGIEDPRFADAAQPYRMHPSIPEHSFEEFGCSLCHAGQGLATTTEAA